MTTDDILDPLVRVAFAAKRSVDKAQVAVEAAARDRDFAQESLNVAESDLSDARDELHALMDAMTSEQHQELVQAELLHGVAAAKKAAGGVPFVFPAAQVRAAFSEALRVSDPLALHKPGSPLERLRVTFR